MDAIPKVNLPQSLGWPLFSAKDRCFINQSKGQLSQDHQNKSLHHLKASPLAIPNRLSGSTRQTRLLYAGSEKSRWQLANSIQSPQIYTISPNTTHQLPEKISIHPSIEVKRFPNPDCRATLSDSPTLIQKKKGDSAIRKQQ